MNIMNYVHIAVAAGSGRPGGRLRGIFYTACGRWIVEKVRGGLIVAVRMQYSLLNRPPEGNSSALNMGHF